MNQNKKQPTCIYDRWFEGELINPNGFTRALIKCWHEADGYNRTRLIQAFPEYFKHSRYR